MSRDLFIRYWYDDAANAADGDGTDGDDDDDDAYYYY